MEDKFFDIDEAMIEYSEMNSFDFNSSSYLAKRDLNEEYAQEPCTFKYGTFDVLDMLKSMFAKTSLQKN